MKVRSKKYHKGTISFETGTISVVVITYNQEQFLTKSLESVFAQSRKADEILIIDNGSTDGTAELIQKLGNKVKCIRYRKNRGAKYAFYSSLKQASCDYVILLSADDWLASSILEKESKILDENPDIGVVYAQSFSVFDKKKELRYAKPVGNKTVIGRNEFKRLLTQGDFVPLSTAMIRKSASDRLGSFDLNLNFRGDYELWIRLARYYPFAYIAKPLAYYRIHNNYGIKSPGFLGSLEQELGYILKKHLPRTESVRGLPKGNNDLDNLRTQAYHNYYLLLFNESILAGNFKKGWEFLLKSLQTNPLSLSHLNLWYPFAWYIKKKLLL